jgi:hypothetical protein
MLKKLLLISALASIMVLTACNLGSQIPATQEIPTVIAEALPPEVVVEIQNRASELLGVAVDQIQIETVEKRDWPNGCLGLAGPDEVCTEAITPGWLVVVNINGVEHRFRVDETGTNIRQEP